jgi:CYTH domain-containing protein
MEIELERTFLLKYKPKNLEKSSSCEILDIYFPKEERHPALRLRSRDGKKFEMTKKVDLSQTDMTEKEEHTIPLSDKEFFALEKIGGKKVRKIRYYYLMPDGKDAEIGIFLDDLAGLGLVDFEFENREEKEKFIAPDFCLVDVSQDEWSAGGILAGKSYSQIENHLEKYNYKKIV